MGQSKKTGPAGERHWPGPPSGCGGGAQQTDSSSRYPERRADAGREALKSARRGMSCGLPLQRAGAARAADIDADEAIFAGMIDHVGGVTMRLAGIDIGAQIVARDAIKFFSSQNVLRGHATS